MTKAEQDRKELFFLHCNQFVGVFKWIYHLSHNNNYTLELLASLRKLEETSRKLEESSKRKMENGTFEEKLSAVLNNFWFFSNFFTQLHTVSRCLLEDCNVGKFATELARSLKEKPYEKTTFVDLCSSYLEAFQTMLACSTQDKNTI